MICSTCFATPNRFQKGGSTNSKKRFKKHGTSIIDIFVSLTPDISQYLKK